MVDGVDARKRSRDGAFRIDADILMTGDDAFRLLKISRAAREIGSDARRLPIWCISRMN